MVRGRLAENVANSYLAGKPPSPQHQGPAGSIPGVPTQPEPQVIDIEMVECPGKCGFARTWTHQTHCCTGCARGDEHTNNCEKKPWGIHGKDADKVKVQQLLCECLYG